MPFITKNYETVRADILRDIENLLSSASTGADSDYAIRANAVASGIEGLYQHQQWAARQILPDSADTDYLERYAGMFGITRKIASVAIGSLNFTGTPGSSIPLGTEAKTVAGIAFVTTVAGVIGAGGTANVAAQASVAGAGGNQSPGVALTLTAAPSGVISAAMISVMVGGVDVESDSDLLARLLYRLRNPPHGGAAHDYIAWALEVSGVTAAYSYPLRRGLGTVDVIIATTGGLPSVQLVADTQAHIDGLRPLTADCLVFAPTAVPVNVTASLTLSGATLADATSAIQVALAAYFAGFKPGDTAYRNRIASIIQGITGVVDFNLTSPAANVTTVVDNANTEMPTLGVVTLT